jgi:hypothetical protein
MVLTLLCGGAEGQQMIGSIRSALIVRSLHMRPDLDGVLMDDIPVLRCEALRVCHVPAQRFEERIEELFAELELVVISRAEVFAVFGEGFAEFEDGVGENLFDATPGEFGQGNFAGFAQLLGTGAGLLGELDLRSGHAHSLTA